MYGVVRCWQRCRSEARSIDTVEPIRRDAWRQLGIITAGFVIGCTLLLVSAVVRYHDTPHIAYNTAVSMLDQLSLGRIKLPQKNTIPTPGGAPSPQAPPTNETTAPKSSPSPSQTRSHHQPISSHRVSSPPQLMTDSTPLNWRSEPGRQVRAPYSLGLALAISAVLSNIGCISRCRPIIRCIFSTFCC